MEHPCNKCTVLEDVCEESHFENPLWCKKITDWREENGLPVNNYVERYW